jgi:8-oxo-dGTP pyrophosphatase MutT (NUDIX family)
MLDSTAAGGVASGETPLSTILHECNEEASLPSDLVRRNAKAAGAITHFYVRDRRSGGEVGLLQPECQYVYELPVPSGLVCKPNDNEVEAFQLLTVSDIVEALARREFKPNSALVMLDFMIRHGVVTSENEKDYLEIITRLHRRLDFPLR